ncbi:MAG: helix-turn-helix transcriptional regulator, partial [Christensenellaceae bacterium]|nr:helix-turn-helix transcriptional regulator [Christensenellaceae bacterium]
AITAVIGWTYVKKRLPSYAQAVVLTVATYINIGVWLLEQFVSLEFEFLSISYIMSELFILCLLFMLQENERRAAQVPTPAPEAAPEPPAEAEEEPAAKEDPLAAQRTFFAAHLPSLTPTEKLIYDLYLEGKGTKDVLEALDIKENTLKYHNKNLYSKLGVSSRKQMLAIAMDIGAQKQSE